MSYKITFATSIKTGQSIYKPYKSRLPHYQRIINFAMTMIRDQKLIDYPDGIEIHVKPARPRSLGVYYSGRRLIHLNCRLTLSTIISTLLHELKHSEQYFHGRLAQKFDNKTKSYMECWNGESIVSSFKKLSFKKYETLPWEIEAREASKHTNMICDAYVAMYGEDSLKN